MTLEYRPEGVGEGRRVAIRGGHSRLGELQVQRPETGSCLEYSSSSEEASAFGRERSRR